MAQVIPFVAKILATKIIAGITVAAVVKTAAVYAISQMLTKSARSKASGLGSGTDLTMTREPAPVRRIVYGETRVSGPMAFANISGDKNSTLSLAILLAAHECEAVGAYLVDDEQVTPGAGGDVTTGTFAGKLSLVSHLGDQTTADSLLMANAPGVWTSAHVLRGITYLASKLTYDTDVYSGGLPNLSVILRGKKLYDPRTSTTAWSSNPALILRDYLANTDYGLGCTADEIDDALIIEAANICDETVSGSARYACNGTFTTDAEPATIIETILSTMAGSITYSGSKFRVFAGAYSAPTVALDESDMAGAIEFQPTTGIREACNIVKGTFTSPADLYQARDFPQYRADAHITEDGEEIATDLDLAWVSNSSQARRLAKIYERRARNGGAATLKCKLTAFRCQTGETIAVNNTRLGWDEKEFTVQEWRFAIAGDGTLGVELTCRETASNIYDWDASDEVALTRTSTISNPPTTMENVTGAATGAATESLPGGDFSDIQGNLFAAAPVGGLQWRGAGENLTLYGHSEYTPSDGSGVSSPPKKYRVRTLSGSVRLLRHVGPSVFTYNGYTATLSGAATYDLDGAYASTGAHTGVGDINQSSCGWSSDHTGPVSDCPNCADLPASVTTRTSKVVTGNGSVWYGSYRADLSVEYTEQMRIDFYLDTVALGAWGTKRGESAWKPRTSGFKFWYSTEHGRGAWTNAVPGWTYRIDVPTEVIEYGSTGDWTAGATESTSVTADSAGNLSLPEFALTVERGWRRRGTGEYTITPLEAGE